jgi:hypothetical protein
MLGLVRAVHRHANILCLLLRELAELHSDPAKVQPGHFLIQPLGQAIDRRLVLVLVLPQIELGKISREWAKAQEELRDLRCELDVSKETMNDVQNKLFESQIELLKKKKELDDTKIKRIDNLLLFARVLAV